MNVLRLSIFLALLFGMGSCTNNKPEVQSDPADALASKIEQAINKSAWDETHWVAFSFAGRRHFVWDKAEGYCQVKFKDLTIQFPTDSFQLGQVYIGDTLVEDSTKQALLANGWAAFCNDAFWLNAPAKLRDPGAELTLIDTGASPQLLVTYTSGGVTPGDQYLWQVDSSGRPISFKMTVRSIEEPWYPSTWEGWQKLKSGAWVSTSHNMGDYQLSVSPVVGGKSWGDLELSQDPFHEIR